MTYNILKAVEFDKLSAKFRKQHKNANALWAAGWGAQPKYDGVFGLASVLKGKGRMLSRTGEWLRSCDHIIAALNRRAPSNHEGYTVLGEIWMPGTPFPQISGMARRHNAEPELCFVVHDILPYDLVTNEPYSSRLNTVQCLFGEAAFGVDPEPNLLVAETLPYTGDINATACSLVAEGGFDGVMLKDYLAGYHVGVVKNGEIVKVKPTLTFDLKVGAAMIERGEKTGREVMTIAVDYKGVTTWVGSGIPHSMGTEDVLDKIVEIECMGITADGKLREPRFKGVRFDKVAPDA